MNPTRIPQTEQTPETPAYLLRTYPGEEEAKRLGYTLQSSNGAKTKATYVKNVQDIEAPVFLTVSGQGKEQVAGLDAFAGGMVRLSIDSFSFPHPKFALFEKQLINALEKLA